MLKAVEKACLTNRQLTCVSSFPIRERLKRFQVKEQHVGLLRLALQITQASIIMLSAKQEKSGHWIVGGERLINRINKKEKSVFPLTTTVSQRRLEGSRDHVQTDQLAL